MESENGNYVADGAWRMQMESKGETVDDVVTAATTFQCEGRIRADRVKFIAADIARRCKEAHERDVADLRRCLKDAPMFAAAPKRYAALCKTGSSALSELAEDLKVIADWTNGGYGFTAISKAQRIVAELAKHNITLIPQECYGCGVLKTLSVCRAIAEGRENEESEGVVK